MGVQACTSVCATKTTKPTRTCCVVTLANPVLFSWLFIKPLTANHARSTISHQFFFLLLLPLLLLVSILFLTLTLVLLPSAFSTTGTWEPCLPSHLPGASRVNTSPPTSSLQRFTHSSGRPAILLLSVRSRGNNTGARRRSLGVCWMVVVRQKMKQCVCTTVFLLFLLSPLSSLFSPLSSSLRKGLKMLPVFCRFGSLQPQYHPQGMSC